MWRPRRLALWPHPVMLGACFSAMLTIKLTEPNIKVYAGYVPVKNSAEPANKNRCTTTNFLDPFWIN